MATRVYKLLSLFATLLALLVVVVALLRGLDFFVRGAGERDPKVFATVEDLERAAGERLVLPTYFPDSLVWPPAEIRASGGRKPKAALLTFKGRPDGADRLHLGQTLGGASVYPALLEPPGPRAEGWQEVRVQVGRRAMLVRLRGPRGELLRMAASLRLRGHDVAR
jgi:hypothetical protein